MQLKPRGMLQRALHPSANLRANGLPGIKLKGWSSQLLRGRNGKDAIILPARDEDGASGSSPLYS